MSFITREQSPQEEAEILLELARAGFLTAEELWDMLRDLDPVTAECRLTVWALTEQELMAR